MKNLGELEALIDSLRSLVDGVSHVEVEPTAITDLQFSRLIKDCRENPDERWDCIGLGGDAIGKWLCVPEVPKSANNRLQAAILLSPLHMQLVSWWLTHAWRFVELSAECSKSLADWNLHVAAILARALIEEVGCLLYEARAISECWTVIKQRTSPDAATVRNALFPLLSRFRTDSRELEGLGGTATNVMTYVDKLIKQSGLADLRAQYNWLSNAAHPAIGSRFAYHSPPVVGAHGAATFWRVTKRPVSVADRTEGLEYFLAHCSADALLNVAPIGSDVLWQSLRFVDDFGLTTKAYGLTDQAYWRKLRHRSVEIDCPCGCGKWTSSKHAWGRTGPVVEITREATGLNE